MRQYRDNPLASPWMWSGSYCPPEGKRDTYFVYVLEVDLDASQTLSDQPFLFDGDGCFVWRVAASAANGGAPYFSWRDSLGRQLSNQLLRIPGWCGGAGEHSPLPVVEIIEPGARWSYTASETAGEASTLTFALIGVKRK